METLILFLQTLNTLSPIGIVALLAVVIFMLVRGRTAADAKLENVATNHLHEMPELVETMRDMNRTLIALDSYLRARLNGGPKRD